MSEALYEKLIAGEGILILERLEGGRRFRVLGEPPNWTALLFHGVIAPGQEVDPVQVFEFLDHFLREITTVWDAPDFEGRTSDPWTETLANREELAFSATAKRVGSTALLLVRGLGVDFEERCRILRKARELALAHERLLKESSEKETLLHCLAHDVAGPLGTISNCLKIIEAEETLSGAGRELLRLARSASHRQHSSLGEMLALFADELRSLDQFSRDCATAPEILDCAHSVLRSLRYSFEIKAVSLELLLSPPTDRVWKVVGHRERLERILYNLLEDSLRHAPAGSTVTLRLEDEGPAIRVSVSDQRPLCGERSPDAESEDPSPGRQADTASSAVGLFFCRTMIRHWNGDIGHETVPEGQSCVWFRLAKPGSAGAGEPRLSVVP